MAFAEWSVVVESKSSKWRNLHVLTSGRFFHFFFFFKTNTNDSRLNDLLRWIFFLSLSLSSALCRLAESKKPVSGRRTNRLLHGPVNHRLGNQQSPSDRKDAWCFKLLQASPLSAPPSSSFLSIPRARAWNRCSMTPGITRRIKMRWGGWKIEHVVRPQWLFSVI